MNERTFAVPRKSPRCIRIIIFLGWERPAKFCAWSDLRHSRFLEEAFGNIFLSKLCSLLKIECGRHNGHTFEKNKMPKLSSKCECLKLPLVQNVPMSLNIYKQFINNLAAEKKNWNLPVGKTVGESIIDRCSSTEACSRKFLAQLDTIRICWFDIHR